MVRPCAALLAVFMAVFAVHQGCAEAEGEGALEVVALIAESEVAGTESAGDPDQEEEVNLGEEDEELPQVDEVVDNATDAGNATADVNATAVNATPVNSSGNGTWDPQDLQMPYHRHMKANTDKWAQMGGWSKAHQKALMAAKKRLSAAKQEMIDAADEKEIADMGCPCPGEKYYELVHESAATGVDISKSPNMSDVNASTVAEMLNSTNHTASNRTSDHAAKLKRMKSDANLVKRMKKKYGRPGPNSSWQPRHEGEMKRATTALKRATLEENAAFKVALPEFRKMKEEDPAFFTNGDCQCPSSWTKADAAFLAAKETKDVEDNYWEELKLHRRMVAEMDGSNERLMKQEMGANDTARAH